MSDAPKTDNGGAAFPSADGGGLSALASPRGMSLLDYFAAHAMQGLLAKMEITEQMVPARQDDIDEIAATAYEIARAMLEAKKQLL